MDIKIGKFRIEADKSQFILYFERKKEAYSGKEPPLENEMLEEFAGYFPTIESCLRMIPTKALLRSDCVTFEQVLDVLKEYRTLIKNALKGA